MLEVPGGFGLSRWVVSALGHFDPESFRSSKASDPDNIPSKFLKKAASEVAPALQLIFTASLQQAKVPDDWKTAEVTPIFRKGDCSTLISAVLLNFSKPFGKVPYPRLLLKLHQYGVRGPLLSWKKFSLTGRSQQVLVEGKSSSSVPVVSRVQQAPSLALFCSSYISTTSQTELPLQPGSLLMTVSSVGR